MEKNGKLRPIVWSIVRWPAYLTVLLVVLDVCVFAFINTSAGWAVTAYLVLYVTVLLIVGLTKKRSLVQELVRYGVNYGQVQRKLQSEMDIPFAVTDNEGHILWSNKGFNALAGDRIRTRQPIAEIFPELDKSVYPKDFGTSETRLIYGEMNYRAQLRSVAIESFTDDSYWNSEKRRPHNQDSAELVCIYLYDETQITKLKREIIDKEAIIGLLYIDNYDEALESIDEVRRSLLTALVDRKINKYFQNYDTIIKKIEKDKYILVFQNQYLEQLKAAKFPILDEVRAVNIGNDMSVTISIGIGVKAENYTRGYESARAAIDLALGRGGDQVVIKGAESVEYYGGKSSSVEKNTKVKSRVKAHALKELIEAKDTVLIMGHSMPDIDSFGAAVGVYRIAMSLGKEAHIVLKEASGPLCTMVSKFTENGDYADMLISPAQALESIDNTTMVVVVDVNRPSFTECPELIEKAKSVVVLDHHRKSDESIDNVSLSYIETAASSACEVVAEILQYIGDGVKLKAVEADAMFAGIMIDSNNFLSKTGIRTFEAAAFLKRNGADVTRIRKVFRTDINEYATKARAIASTEIYLKYYAFAKCEAADAESPTILGAQVANELMDVNNIKASFVFTEYNNLIYVSARSIDEVNVQVIMEKLGGGGHMSAAGVQLADCTIDEAYDKVKQVLKRMSEGGDL